MTCIYRDALHILLYTYFLYELYQLQTGEVIRKLLLDGYFALEMYYNYRFGVR